MSPLILIVTSCFLFSVLAGIIKFTSQFIHPVEQAFFRNIISIIFFIPFLISKKISLRKKANFNLLILRSIFGGVTMILLFWSYSLIPLSQVMAISFSTPLFIYFGSIIFLNEKNSPKKTLIMFLGFIFTIIIIRPDLEVKFGTVLALIAALTHAIAGLLVKKISKDENVLTLMFSMIVLMSPITLLPSVYVWETPDNLKIISLLFMIAVIATLGNYCWTKAISLSRLTNIMPFDFSKLIFATILGLFFFNERIDIITVIFGSGLIICNTYIAGKIKKNAEF